MHSLVRSDRFPRMLCYTDAVYEEAKIKAFSTGKNKGKKPLAERRRHWLTIRKEGLDVVVCLYSTDIITYKPDNTIIVRQGGWSTSTTHETIGAILDTNVTRKNHLDWITCMGGSFLLRKSGDNVFKPSGSGRSLIPVNPLYPKIHLLNRAEYKKVYEPYKPFINYVVAATKLRGTCTYNSDEYRQSFGDWRDVHEYQLTALMLNEDDWYKASLHIYQKCYFHADDPVAEVKTQIADVIKRVHRDKVFVTEEVQDGRVVVDSNRRFFD